MRKIKNRLLSKPAATSEVRGETAHRTAVYTSVHEDSSTVSTKQFADAVGFGKRSSKLLPWLTTHDFLTEKLRQCAGNARLDILQETWISSNWWDCWVLNLPKQPVLHREIQMWAHMEICWYARTILPQTTYDADQQLFERLTHEPLGNLIFHGQRIQRISLRHYSINASNIEYHWLTSEMHKNKTTLWARLAEFKLDEQYPLFLVEIFLPGLDKWL